ncbi:hypothetical protein BJY04DRAFT_8981 [Aspergillus karnatakaensis]|uniref:uncharacterized protein n=1 Tax=Aspergillus karnatakaensis TaxID=1810916 RepID=UPI003CCDD500
MANAARSAQCVRHLDGIAQATSNEGSKQWWENQMFRFNLWCENNFVFASRRASMDWRLRNAPLLESSVCELLDDLQSHLLCTRLQQPDHWSTILTNSLRRAALIHTTSLNQKPDQEKPVDKDLVNLFRLSRAIRRSGILRRFVKIGSYVEYDDNGVNLTEEFRKGAEKIIHFRLRQCPASQGLQQRVVDTICIRQQHFSYLKVKWEKGKSKPAGRADAAPPTVPRSMLGATLSVSGSLVFARSKTQMKMSPVAVPLHVPSMMTATTAQPDRMKKPRSVKSAQSAEHDEVQCNIDDLPLPPKVPTSAVEYECPYCYMVCSSGEFSGER